MSDDATTKTTENPSDADGSPGRAGASHTPIRNEESDEHSIGIDTIAFRVSSFEVAEGTELELRASANAGTGETSDTPLYRVGGDGRLVEGNRAFANLGPISVTISGPDAMYVEVTMPRLLGEDNWIPIDTSLRFEMAVKVLYERLRTFGITASLQDAQVCRLDICCNVETAGTLPDYEPVLERCSLPRMECRRYDDGGYQFKNGEREFLVYAKGAKERDDEHTQRFEYRLRRARSVQRHVGVDVVGDIQQNFDRLRDAFKRFVSGLFPKMIDGEEQPVHSFREAISAAIERVAKRTSWPHCEVLQALGVRHLQEHDAADDFLAAVEDDSGRMAASRYRRKFTSLSPVADLMSRKKRTATDMLGELLDAFKLLDSPTK